MDSVSLGVRRTCSGIIVLKIQAYIHIIAHSHIPRAKCGCLASSSNTTGEPIHLCQRSKLVQAFPPGALRRA